ncbi:hypothetical protein DW094_01900 [Ruminococcaceae bacterium AM07-15]|nr:hypothetical protein DW094_01900 [Ruminococcaceae bacterium AM07-15]
MTARAFLLPGRAASRRRHPLPGLLGCGPGYSGSAGRNQGETARRARQIKKGSSPAGYQRGLFCCRAGRRAAAGIFSLVCWAAGLGTPAPLEGIRVKQPGERDRSKKEAVRLVISAGFFVAGPGGEPPQASSPWFAGLRAWVLRLRWKESG